MAFFQNLFNQEFLGNLVLADRHQSLTFAVPANTNSSRYTLAHSEGPWDLSSEDTLTINYCLNEDLKAYSSLSVQISGTAPSSTTNYEVVQNLNNNSVFSSFFYAEIKKNTVIIGSKSLAKIWVENSGAELVLNFNKNAPVAELPSYFSRHTLENWSAFADSTGQLLELDESDANHQAIITRAGLDPLQMKQDWELLQGRSGLFIFEKLTLDGSGRVTQKIEYHAGAKVGDLAKKTKYTYVGGNTNPATIAEIPYVLSSPDLITP